MADCTTGNITSYSSFKIDRYIRQPISSNKYQLGSVVLVNKQLKHGIIVCDNALTQKDIATEEMIDNKDVTDFHGGYYQIAKEGFDQMTNKLHNMNMTWNDLEKISITGRGFGGGIALITGYLLHNTTYENDMEIIAFGAPKVLKNVERNQTNQTDELPKWKSFVDAVERQGSKLNIVRINHENDPVPENPRYNENLTSPWFHIGYQSKFKEESSNSGTWRTSYIRYIFNIYFRNPEITKGKIVMEF